MAFRLVKKSFSLSGHRTSVALEPEFWAALARMAGARGMSLAALVAQIDFRPGAGAAAGFSAAGGSSLYTKSASPNPATA